MMLVGLSNRQPPLRDDLSVIQLLEMGGRKAMTGFILRMLVSGYKTGFI